MTPEERAGAVVHGAWWVTKHNTAVADYDLLESLIAAAIRAAVEAAIAELRIGLAAEQELHARSEMDRAGSAAAFAGPDSESYTTLAAAIDAHDQAMKGK